MRADEDPLLMDHLTAQQIPLTVCPLSNVRLAVFEQMAQHNILQMLDRDILVTVNSDDPAYFGGYLNENYQALVADLGATSDQIVQLIRNGFRASFMPEADKRLWQDCITAALADLP